jgi:CRISPR system Cascade subunit CasE
MRWVARCFIPQQLAIQHKLSNCYDWHKLAWTCFLRRPDAKRDFLFRLDTTPEGVLLHILGEEEPVRPELCPEETWKSRKIPAAFLEHVAYRFDVICNPGRKVTVYTVDGKRKKNSRREAIIHKDAQEAWFIRKAHNSGFSLAPGTLRIDPCQTHYFYKNDPRGACKKGTHIGARFYGVLHVQDREKFRKAFSTGIGSARAFGFGLLLLTPVRAMYNNHS